MIFKGKQVIIPDAMRSDILHQLHEAHLGIQKTRLLMREPVYGPNICEDIETFENCCSTSVCQESQTEHHQQPRLSSTPWTKEESDVFQKKGQLLLVTDYHSTFYLVEKIPALQSPTNRQFSTNIKPQLFFNHHQVSRP